MSTTIAYKGVEIATAENQTKTLLTAGKFLEDDITITDVTSGGGGGGADTITFQFTYGTVDFYIPTSATFDAQANTLTIPKNSMFVCLCAISPNTVSISGGTYEIVSLGSRAAYNCMVALYVGEQGGTITVI